MTLHAITRTMKFGWGKPTGALDETQASRLMQEIELYINMLRYPVERLLESDLLHTMNIVVNCDPNSPFAEVANDDGSSPTAQTLQQQLVDPRMRYHACCDWGANPGSCNALNQVIRSIPADNPADTLVLIFSKEALLDPLQVEKACQMMHMYPQLAVAGFFRECHWYYSPWQVPQNTAAVWRLKCLLDIGGFDRHCEGNDGNTIIVPTMADPVLLAGMDDFYALLTIMKYYEEQWFWTMIGSEAPFPWKVSGKTGLELELHDKKIARQAIVMQHWVERLFPGENHQEIFNKLFSHRVLFPAKPILLAK